MSDLAVPLIPNELLSRFLVSEPYDTRFASNARLLQSIWREQSGIAPGTHVAKNGARRLLGSRLPTGLARQGRNFVTPAIAQLARRETLYREVGAVIDEERLWGNLLSSQPLTFNLFGFSKLNPAFGRRFLRALLPKVVDKLVDVKFEHSPGRGDPTFVGDGTAFDVAFIVRKANGASCLIGVEVKYSEAMRQSRPISARIGELAVASGIYKNVKALERGADQANQLLAQHMLAHSMVHDSRLYDEAVFLFIAPAGNREAWQAASAYARRLLSLPKSVEFRALTLEAVITAIGVSGEHDLEARVRRRYADFSPVHSLLNDWQPYQE